MAKFKTIITTVGAAKIAAVLAGTGSIVLDNTAKMAVGDGSGTLPTPNPAQTKLVNEVHRASINKASIDASDPKNIIAELVIPPETGGFWLREMALYDAAGTLLAVGNMAETYKPSLSEGAGRKMVIRMVIAVSEVSAVTITMDTSTVMATQDYVDTEIDKHAKSRNHPDATLTAKGFTQLNSATDSASETQAATPKAVKTVMDATSLKAPLASPALSGVPTAPTAPPGTNTQQLANTAFVRAAIAALINSSPGVLDTLGELAASLGNDANFATTMTNALAGKQPKDTTLTNLSGKDVAGLLQYLGLQFLESTTSTTANAFNSIISPDGRIRIVLANNGDWGVQERGGAAIPLPLARGGTGAKDEAGARDKLGVTAALAAKSPINSPEFTGTPKAPTAPTSTNNTQLANTSFVHAVVAELVNSSPAALDTLKELADALGNDANFAATMMTALAGKQPKDTTLTNLSGKDVAGLLQYLGLQFLDSVKSTAPSAFTSVLSPDGKLRIVMANNGIWGVQDSTGNVVPLPVNRGGIGATDVPGALKNLGLAAGVPAIGIPFFWPSNAMPNTVMDEWADMVFLKMNDATFSAAQYPKLARVWPGLKLTDCRGEFIRIADDGRGVDSGRALLSAQGDTIQNITGSFLDMAAGPNNNTTGAFTASTLTPDLKPTVAGGTYKQANYYFDASRVARTSTETRPRNIAFNFLVRAK